MSIPFSGTISRSGGLLSAIAKQIRFLNLKPVKRIVFRFDPFTDHVQPTRDFLFYMSGPKVSATNPHCSLKTEIVSDRSEPLITINLQSGEKVIIKTTNLTSLNILQLYNKYITSLVPPDPAKLKAEQELLEKKKKRKRPRKIKEGSKHRGVEY